MEGGGVKRKPKNTPSLCLLCNRPVRARVMHPACEREIQLNGWPT